jgi:hypothetical protein
MTLPFFLTLWKSKIWMCTMRRWIGAIIKFDFSSGLHMKWAPLFRPKHHVGANWHLTSDIYKYPCCYLLLKQISLNASLLFAYTTI